MLSTLKSLQPTKKYFATMFLTSCVLLAIFTLVVYQQSTINQSTSRWVLHSYEILRYTRNILIHVYDSDAAARSYLSTGAANDLASYNTSIDSADHDLDPAIDLT